MSFNIFILCLLMELKNTNCLNRSQLGILIHNDFDLHKLYMAKREF